MYYIISIGDLAIIVIAIFTKHKKDKKNPNGEFSEEVKLSPNISFNLKNKACIKKIVTSEKSEQ